MSASLRDQCTRKVKYRSRAKAARSIRCVVGRGFDKRKDPDSKLMPYQCPHCGFWHMGHTVPAHIYFARKKGLPSP